MYAAAEILRTPVSKYPIQPECGELEGWRGTGRPNPSRETKFSDAKADREILVFLVHLTTCRIDYLTRLIHALAYMCDHTYVCDRTLYVACHDKMGHSLLSSPPPLIFIPYI